MSKSIWDKLVGDGLQSTETMALSSLDLNETIKKINIIEKNMIASINTIDEPDYIGDFIERGGLIGLTPMGHNAPSSGPATPELSHTQLAQIAVNHSRLESTLARLKKSLSETFETLNQSMTSEPMRLDASAQQALADLVTHRERARNEIKSLVLKPKTVALMYSCFERLEKDSAELQKEFERCTKLAKKR